MSTGAARIYTRSTLPSPHRAPLPIPKISSRAATVGTDPTPRWRELAPLMHRSAARIYLIPARLPSEDRRNKTTPPG
jgi:hypothetical protein